MNVNPPLGPVIFIVSTFIQMILSRNINFINRPWRISSNHLKMSNSPSSASINPSIDAASIRTKAGDNGCEACDAKPLRSLKETVKPYKRHAIVCIDSDRDSWPRAIENVTDSFALRLSDSLNSKKDKTFPIRVTGCTYNSSGFSGNPVIIYPEGFVVDVPDSKVDEFTDILSMKKALDIADLSGFHGRKTPWDHLLLCCIHGNRDKRCGEKGWQVYNDIKRILSHKQIPESKISIYGSTHIGGHEFAGTMISYPLGHWYGYLSIEKVEPVLEAILANEAYDECLRGIGCNDNQW